MAKAKTAAPAAPVPTPKKGSKPPAQQPAAEAPKKGAKPPAANAGNGKPTAGKAATATKPAEATPPPAPKVNPPMPAGEREVIYDKLEVIYLSATCEEAQEQDFGPYKSAIWPALTEEIAKELIGWEEVEVKDDSVLLTDENGRHVRCHNNSKNRSYDNATALKYAYDMLNKFWVVNGETIIIGETGNVTSGQHRLTGYILACQLWEKEPHWKEKWPEKPTLECIIVRGTNESSETLRTLDNVKPRSVEDVFYSNTDVLGDLGKTDRKMVIKAAANAVRVVWDRTGLKDNPYTPYLSNSEAVEFLDAHPSILEASKYVWEQDKAITGGAITGNKGLKLGLGTAAGLLYLMAASEGEHGSYVAEPSDTTAKVDEAWAKACEFWKLLATQHPDVRDVRHSKVIETVEEGGETKERERYIFTTEGKRDEKVAILINAFIEYAHDGAVKAKNINPPTLWKKEEDGSMSLNAKPMLGGIDIGGIKEKDEDGEEATEEELTPEQVEANKAEAAAARKKKAEEAAEKIRALRHKKTGMGHDTVKAPGEVAKPDPVKHDADGKPPAPKLKVPPKGKKPAAK